MSDEIKKTVLNTLAEPIANSAKNITDKPTQNMGTTLADIWYLVFGGISQAAEKRKLKYSYALQEFEKELKEKISKIPDDKLIEPDMQIVAPALESSKYCIEHIELRKMFVNLISSSLNNDVYHFTHPIYEDIIRHLSPEDAKLLEYLYQIQCKHIPNNKIRSFNFKIKLFSSLNTLEKHGLINTNLKDTSITNYTSDDFNSLIINHSLEFDTYSFALQINRENDVIKVKFTNLGITFCKICLFE